MELELLDDNQLNSFRLLPYWSMTLHSSFGQFGSFFDADMEKYGQFCCILNFGIQICGPNLFY